MNTLRPITLCLVFMSTLIAICGCAKKDWEATAKSILLDKEFFPDGVPTDMGFAMFPEKGTNVTEFCFRIPTDSPLPSIASVSARYGKPMATLKMEEIISMGNPMEGTSYECEINRYGTVGLAVDTNGNIVGLLNRTSWGTNSVLFDIVLQSRLRPPPPNSMGKSHERHDASINNTMMSTQAGGDGKPASQP